MNWWRQFRLSFQTLWINLFQTKRVTPKFIMIWLSIGRSLTSLRSLTNSFNLVSKDYSSRKMVDKLNQRPYHQRGCNFMIPPLHLNFKLLSPLIWWNLLATLSWKLMRFISGLIQIESLRLSQFNWTHLVLVDSYQDLSKSMERISQLILNIGLTKLAIFLSGKTMTQYRLTDLLAWIFGYILSQVKNKWHLIWK